MTCPRCGQPVDRFPCLRADRALEQRLVAMYQALTAVGRAELLAAAERLITTSGQTKEP